MIFYSNVSFLIAGTGKTVNIGICEEYTQEIRSCCECGMFSPIRKKIVCETDDVDNYAAIHAFNVVGSNVIVN